MKDDKEILESLIVGGVIGAALGALLTNGSKTGTAIGTLAGVALLATYKANEQASQTTVPLIIEQDGYLWKVLKNGEKIRLRKLDKPQISIQKHFDLK